MRRLLSGIMSPFHGRCERNADAAKHTEALPLYDIYEDTFEVVRATTPELLEASQRLRYQVYCVENPFESPAEHPNGLERDAYDTRSTHTLLIHRRSGMVVGNVRIVFPNPVTPLASFPLQKITHIDKIADAKHVLWSGEISRFCISKDFRKRENDGLYTGVFLPYRRNPFRLFDKHAQQRVIPFAPLGLIRAIFEMGIEQGKIWGYAALEPQFIRLLAKLGIKPTVLGDVVEYHGKRYPVEMDPLAICASVKQTQPEVWKVLTNNGAIVSAMETLVAKYRESCDIRPPRPRFSIRRRSTQYRRR